MDYIIKTHQFSILIFKLEESILPVNLSFYQCSMIQWTVKHI